VVDFFDAGGHVRSDAPAVAGFVGQSELVPLGLSERQKDDLVAFLEALEGEGPPEELLRDPSE
jgi:hypothetical protein